MKFGELDDDSLFIVDILHFRVLERHIVACKQRYDIISYMFNAVACCVVCQYRNRVARDEGIYRRFVYHSFIFIMVNNIIIVTKQGVLNPLNTDVLPVYWRRN